MHRSQLACSMSQIQDSQSLGTSLLDKTNQMDVILHLFSFLPSSHIAAAAKLVCKAAYEKFRDFKVIYASCSDLPTTCFLDYLKQHSENLNQEQQALMSAAAKQGDLVRVQFLRQHACAWDDTVCAAAAGAGQLAVLQWLRSQRPPCPWDWEVCTSAAASGQLDVLKWARAQSPPCDWGGWVCEEAARHGHIPILQWLRAQELPCPWDWRVVEAAAERGHLDVLQWLRAQSPPCPWSTEVCVAAVCGGHLDVLQWLRAQDPPCPWDYHACLEAAGKGHVHVLEWILAQNDAPIPADYVAWLVPAASRGHLGILKLVAEKQPMLLSSWHKVRCLEAARRRNQTAVVEWLEFLPDVV